MVFVVFIRHVVMPSLHNCNWPIFIWISVSFWLTFFFLPLSCSVDWCQTVWVFFWLYTIAVHKQLFHCRCQLDSISETKTNLLHWCETNSLYRSPILVQILFLHWFQITRKQSYQTLLLNYWKESFRKLYSVFDAIFFCHVFVVVIVVNEKCIELRIRSWEPVMNYSFVLKNGSFVLKE